MEVDLTGAPETMPATLYARALDARARRPVLGDAAALDAVSRIEYDFPRTGVTASTAAGVAMRAKLLDDWTADFLAGHPSATVLHLACGLDTRAQRMAFGSGVRWVDVDLPEVAALRERLLPQIAAEPWPARLPMWVMARLPKVRDVGRVLRYRF